MTGRSIAVAALALTGVVLDTLIGPVIVAGAGSFDGRWRTYLAVGRTFR